MADLSLDELTTPLTSDQVKTNIYTAIAAQGTDTTSWEPGAPTRTMIAAFSIIVAAFSQLGALIATGGFLELAAGAWLALVALYVYNEKKLYATFATGTITLHNIGGAIYDYDPDDVVFANTQTGATFRNTGSFTLNPGNTLTIPIRAVEAGSASTSAPGTITTLVTPMLGVIATNLTAVVGTDDEKDPALRQRCSEKLGSLSPNGPWDAFTYAAKNAKRADGSRVGVSRVRLVKDGAGNIAVYVASASGAISGTRTNLATDLGAVDDAIQRNAASITDTANAVSATAVTVPVTTTVYMYNTSGLTQAQIQTRVTSSIVNFFPDQPISGNILSGDPGKVFVDAIRSAIANTKTTDDVAAARLPIFHTVVSAPSADVALTVGQVPVPGTITVNVVQVPPNEGAV